MMRALSFVVAGAPVPKARARVMNGYSFTPKRVRDYELLVRTIAESVVSKRPDWPLDNAAGYFLRVAVYRAARRGDLDNYTKAISDGLQRTCFDDDKRIVEIHAKLFDDKEHPRAIIEVEAL